MEKKENIFYLFLFLYFSLSLIQTHLIFTCWKKTTILRKEAELKEKKREKVVNKRVRLID